MNYKQNFTNAINLYVQGRISLEDAKRQELTAREILKRLQMQSGVILADEVGMGKTFVALAVAVSVALSDKEKRPVVIMVPPSLKEKWPRDYELFREKCLSDEVRGNLRVARAERAVEFLKLLDDPIERRNSIIFLTHGAMSRGLDDGWVKLALIYRALYGRKNAGRLKQVLSRIAGSLLFMGWVDRRNNEVWSKLLSTDPRLWLNVLRKYDIDPEGDNNISTNDDPIPEAIYKVLWELNTDEIYDVLKTIPHRETKCFKENLQYARLQINTSIKALWAQCIRSLHFHLPLLILDEAHHLKNPDTKLASLFQIEDAKGDAEEIARGPLSEVFERMLFLTATPFQLGHYELCSVLERFGGISWHPESAPYGGKDKFLRAISELREKLDIAQELAVSLDVAWGRLGEIDLVIDGCCYKDIELWWTKVKSAKTVSQDAKTAIDYYNQTKVRLKEAEILLHPWVIRHVRDKHLPEPFKDKERRFVFIGKSIIDESRDISSPGISISGNELLPFLLAARASACRPDCRPVFAEGLASSYEAFLYTRKMKENINGVSLQANIVDDDISDTFKMDRVSEWYLNKLENLIPLNDVLASVSHPKVNATVKRVVDLWLKGEKVLVFCHYRATGRVLRQHISVAIQEQILKIGASKLTCSTEDVLKELDRIGKRFFDEDSPIRRLCDEEIGILIGKYSKLNEYNKSITNIVRRYIRTPSFLVRYMSLEKGKLTKESTIQAFSTQDGGGLSLKNIIDDFLKFLVERCGDYERSEYITALESVQTGSHVGADVKKTFGADEIQGDTSGRLIANVRLVNGQAEHETRQKLMLTFNTPFYPEILIASSVMAEGVDLHLNCRFVIHHDLCWNPSTLEQRIGRIDRIGAKAERCGKPINIYIPFIAETQDEKMYRVVMDRERWFKVVMGEKFKLDAKTTEKIASRIPFPQSAAEELAFKLEVV